MRPPTHDLDVYHGEAFDLLHSEAVRRAFDSPRKTRSSATATAGTTLGQSLLLARRLVEAGVRFVNVYDHEHQRPARQLGHPRDNFPRLKDDLLPPADQAFAALIEDLTGRGLLDSTLVVALGEFGRTPKINGQAGRDHWPDCYSVVLAGGGVRGGTRLRRQRPLGAYPDRDPVSPGDLAATLFWRFGLDPTAEIRDLIGRPYRLAEGQPLRALFAG